MDMKLITPLRVARTKKHKNEFSWYGRRIHAETIERVKVLLSMEIEQAVLVHIDEFNFWKNLLVRIREKNLKNFPELYGRRFQTMRLLELNLLLIIRVF